MEILLRVALVLWVVGCLLGTPPAAAQVETPDRKFVFEQDSPRVERVLEKRRESILKSSRQVSTDLDFSAPQIEFLQDSNEVEGKGGLLVSKQGMVVQAEQGRINLDSKDAKLKGDILFSWPEGFVRAEQATMNLESETGQFADASALFEEGQYQLTAERLDKISETDFRMFDCGFTTCYCLDGDVPWQIRGSKMDIEHEGYARARHGWLQLFGLPVLYSPYLLFPAKMERSSGLLFPELGYSRQDGAKLSLPIFIAWDGSTDVGVRPFVETKTRFGTGLDFKRLFSRSSRIETRALYSNESPRGDDLRGTVTDGLYDPTFDEQRIGGFYKQNWRTERGVAVPTSFVADVHYVSDSLFLREMEDDDIGKRNARYTISRAVVRSSVGSYLYGEMAGEYNQALQTNPDLTFQRLPDLLLTTRRSFRPFGYNPYGLKLVSALSGFYTNFRRDEGYYGPRFDIRPTVKVPYHYKNYFNGDLDLSLNHTMYDMVEDRAPGESTDVITGDQRTAFTLGYALGTGVERVYELERSSWLSHITGLGYRNQAAQLRRVKHTIEPMMRYRYVPNTYQDDLPLYDSLDRIRERNLVSYGLRTALLGRFLPHNVAGEAISELTPELDDLPLFDGQGALSDLDIPEGSEAPWRKSQMRRGNVREIAMLGVHQSYSYLEDKNDFNPDRGPFSDIAIDMGIYPSQSFGLRFESDYNAEDNDFSSWGVTTHFRDDRADLLRVRYTFVEDNVSQVEGNLELVLTDRLKFGIYGRFDEEESEFIETRGALRLASSCNCWYMDLGVSDTINPDRQQVFLNINLLGIGDISQDMSIGGSG